MDSDWFKGLVHAAFVRERAYQRAVSAALTNEKWDARSMNAASLSVVSGHSLTTLSMPHEASLSPASVTS